VSMKGSRKEVIAKGWREIPHTHVTVGLHCHPGACCPQAPCWSGGKDETPVQSSGGPPGSAPPATQNHISAPPPIPPRAAPLPAPGPLPWMRGLLEAKPLPMTSDRDHDADGRRSVPTT
jgi:hypothetical protein